MIMANYVKEKSLKKKISKTQQKRIKGTKPELPVELTTDDCRSFQSLQGSVSDRTLKAIETLGYVNMTEVQAKTIPLLLKGRDLRATAKTGSGKTLAFLIPAVELVVKLKYKPRNGTGVIIISPTRELSMQTYGVLRELTRHHSQTVGLVMGGTNRKNEAGKLLKGVTILVATPGRLLDHLKTSSSFNCQNLACLIIDEADRILEFGFVEEMRQIAQLLPRERQTMLFSATKDEKTQSLASLFMGSNIAEVDIRADKEQTTADGLEQAFLVVSPEKRFQVLYHFLSRYHRLKIMVFFNSVASVVFFSTLLNHINIPVLCIHGKLKQEKRASIFYRFCNMDSGTLLCTNIAARGWDIPAVDWIVQYDPPDDPKEYIHRVGRTARAGSKGKALLFLLDCETLFIRYLKTNKVSLDMLDVQWEKLRDIQSEVEQIVNPNYHLRTIAKDAFTSYLRAYDSHSLKGIFNVDKLDLDKIAKSFCLNKTPQVTLNRGKKTPVESQNSASTSKIEFKSHKRKIFDD